MYAPFPDEVLSAIRQYPGNQKCCDCSSLDTDWGNVNHGTLICLECAGKHRALGVHVSFIRSVYMDTWNETQVAMMKYGGNGQIRDYFKKLKIESSSINVLYTSMGASLYRERLKDRVEKAMRGEVKESPRAIRPNSHQEFQSFLTPHKDKSFIMECVFDRGPMGITVSKDHGGFACVSKVVAGGAGSIKGVQVGDIVVGIMGKSMMDYDEIMHMIFCMDRPIRLTFARTKSGHSPKSGLSQSLPGNMNLLSTKSDPGISPRLLSKPPSPYSSTPLGSLSIGRAIRTMSNADSSDSENDFEINQALFEKSRSRRTSKTSPSPLPENLSTQSSSVDVEDTREELDEYIVVIGYNKSAKEVNKLSQEPVKSENLDILESKSEKPLDIIEAPTINETTNKQDTLITNNEGFNALDSDKISNENSYAGVSSGQSESRSKVLKENDNSDADYLSDDEPLSAFLKPGMEVKVLRKSKWRTALIKKQHNDGDFKVIYRKDGSTESHVSVERIGLTPAALQVIENAVKEKKSAKLLEYLRTEPGVHDASDFIINPSDSLDNWIEDDDSLINKIQAVLNEEPGSKPKIDKTRQYVARFENSPLGITLARAKYDGRAEITKIKVDGQASSLGVMVGDVVINVNGVDVLGYDDAMPLIAHTSYPVEIVFQRSALHMLIHQAGSVVLKGSKAIKEELGLNKKSILDDMSSRPSNREREKRHSFDSNDSLVSSSRITTKKYLPINPSNHDEYDVEFHEGDIGIRLDEKMIAQGQLGSVVSSISEKSQSSIKGVKLGSYVIGVNDEEYISHAHTIASLRHMRRPIKVRFKKI